MLCDFCGTETEDCRHRAGHRCASRGAEPGAAQRCYLWYRGRSRDPPPLLIAAGAGTGKTKTLAHRVARLILGGADQRRLLLLTFTRRAALEMTRRAQQILDANQRGRAAGGPEAALLPWGGHISFDRQPAVAPARRHPLAGPSLHRARPRRQRRLMDLVRSDLGLARTRSRFPKKGTAVSRSVRIARSTVKEYFFVGANLKFNSCNCFGLTAPGASVNRAACACCFRECNCITKVCTTCK